MSIPIIRAELINYADGKTIADIKISNLPPVNTYLYVEHLKEHYQVKGYFLKTRPTSLAKLYKEESYKIIVIKSKLRDGLEDACKNT